MVKDLSSLSTSGFTRDVVQIYERRANLVTKNSHLSSITAMCSPRAFTASAMRIRILHLIWRVERERMMAVWQVDKEKSGAGGKVEAVLDVEENGSKNRSVDEEDWLPPPPKLQAIGSGILDDKALQELRLMKQELALLAQSAEDFVKSVNESSKNDDSSLDDSAAEVKGDKSSKRIEREKIIISIQDKCGQKQYRIHMDDTFEKLFKLYAEKEKLKLECLTFCFDGETISPAITPGILGLENDDMIEVHAKSA
ncbi:hypothetical protein AXF42_Ash019513 [Apostasia shenzhenica]|uniref:Rad60/SUMO-like domain-containing protein n=1 Tax=Apostasia shenzhenica TaxID=1088818 RepID=A0A2I0A099_9ASPA|nr:hypothetical protein AXF42_Ash019513 [Apostasia shenzhenica]